MKGKSSKGENDERQKVARNCNHCWKWGHVEKDCFTISNSKGGKDKSAGSLDESEENGPENTSVGGFGLCLFRNHCDDWKWNNCRKVTFTVDSEWCGGVWNAEITGSTQCKCKMKDFECCRL